MKVPELRAAVRVAVSKRGNLNEGNAWFPCIIVDISDHGFAMVCNKPLIVGQVLDFRAELFPQRYFDCKVEIRHFSEAGAGTKITEIDEKALSLWQLFLQEQYSDQLNKSG
jgi:hypothetical protein